ncbi:MAG: hypothetical protein JSW11_00815 [Candidatus Heimdallarchaeota archaeon]|nr:MAG: hypothetical protein JSW11_00815 [Candidatus Heimdallarchaeota archaeon]
MNIVTIQPTEFKNVRTGEITYGFRMYDDHGQTYDNTWETIPDDDMEVLSLIMESSDKETEEMIDDTIGTGLYIGNEWYPWKEIEHLWDY